MTRTFTRCFVLSSPHQEKSQNFTFDAFFFSPSRPFKVSSFSIVDLFRYMTLVYLHLIEHHQLLWEQWVMSSISTFYGFFNATSHINFHSIATCHYDQVKREFSALFWFPFHLTLIIKSYISNKLPIQGISVSKARYYEFLYTRSSIGFSVTICKQRHCNLIGVFWYYLLRNKIHFMFLLCQNVLRR